MFDKIRSFAKQSRHSLVIPDFFYKLDFRIVEIVDVVPTSIGNDGAYLLSVDFGDEFGIKKATVRLLGSYNVEELKAKQVIGILNITPKKIEGHLNEVFLVGVKRNEYEMVCIVPEFTQHKGDNLSLIE